MPETQQDTPPTLKAPPSRGPAWGFIIAGVIAHFIGVAVAGGPSSPEPGGNASVRSIQAQFDANLTRAYFDILMVVLILVGIALMIRVSRARSKTAP